MTSKRPPRRKESEGRAPRRTPSPRRLYLAAYDIAEPERLQEALHILRDYATGGQKSVFECFLTGAEKRELLARVNRLIDPAEDRFILIRLSQRAKTRTLGIGVRPMEASFYYLA